MQHFNSFGGGVKDNEKSHHHHRILLFAGGPPSRNYLSYPVWQRGNNRLEVTFFPRSWRSIKDVRSNFSLNVYLAFIPSLTFPDGGEGGGGVTALLRGVKRFLLFEPPSLFLSCGYQWDKYLPAKEKEDKSSLGCVPIVVKDTNAEVVFRVYWLQDPIVNVYGNGVAAMLKGGLRIR